MATELPEGLKQYFKAQNDHDVDAMAAAFAPEAHVRDEGRDYVGRAAIREWKRETSAKYRIHAEPMATTIQGDAVTVIARVEGSFPGSPADLTYDFVMDRAGLIRRLKIH
jgi:hypothetical protein